MLLHHAYDTVRNLRKKIEYTQKLQIDQIFCFLLERKLVEIPDINKFIHMYTFYIFIIYHI